MVSIPDKINALLARRGILKRDLARALGVSPQTTTDICKGRSAITVPHLRQLVRFFGLSADYWLDDRRGEPTAADQLSPTLHDKIDGLLRTGLLSVEDPAAVFERMRTVIAERGTDYVRRFAGVAEDECELLRLPRSTTGHGGAPGRPARDAADEAAG